MAALVKIGRPWLRLVGSGFFELLGHGGVTLSEALNSEILSFVVGEAEVVLRAEEVFFSLLEVLDGLVDLFDGSLEFAASEVVIASEALFESFHILFKMRDVNILVLDGDELVFVVYGIEGGVAKKGDDRNEKLGADDVHLGVAVRNVDDARVVEVAVGLEERNEDGVFTMLLGAVFVELF